MDIEGVLKSWNDERGFGFIEPVLGGDEVFVHIKAFVERGGRPQVGQKLVFRIEVGPKGKKRAISVRPVRSVTKRGAARNDSPASWGTATYFVILAFVPVLLGVSMMWRKPGWLVGYYLLLSAVCYWMYRADKNAAASGDWRVPEATLLMLGAVGGWPGAIVAQQRLRHKSNKVAFRASFWVTVAANVSGLLILSWLPSIATLRL
ncbi:MAG: DUF1294 domain-containing protein [Betaproteobacteria bacterium]|nr:DUF1294 domain-containing protein [Betaproteobacteria bacterium]